MVIILDVSIYRMNVLFIDAKPLERYVGSK